MSLSRVHVILYVRDQKASTSFFRSVLALEPTLDVPGMTEFELSDGVVLGLMPEAGVVRLLGQAHDPARGHGGPRAELYLLVDDPAAYHARSITAGGTEVSRVSARDWGHEAGYTLDLDGHVVAFARARATTEAT
jgi:catechol 2,3-dioxygenase-like lactoylglutathione lyase family enzyme